MALPFMRGLLKEKDMKDVFRRLMAVESEPVDLEALTAAAVEAEEPTKKDRETI